MLKELGVKPKKSLPPELVEESAEGALGIAAKTSLPPERAQPGAEDEPLLPEKVTAAGTA